jgi:transketolase
MTGTAIRRIVIQQSKRANVGHIGSSLSVADVVAALYGGVLRLPSLDAAERDRFVLGKGHSVLAVYAAMQLRGWLGQAELDTYCADGSLLGVHPDRELAGVDFSTGSLGFGLPVGVGATLAARLQGSDRRVFVLVSDAECNEGSVWEAAMYAAHHRLGRLTVVVDLNGQQALGKTADVLSLTPMVERWRAFGWQAEEVDGHDVGLLAERLGAPTAADAPPRVFVARTIFGKGVSYMEGQLKWHYWPMSDDEYRQALSELDAG